QRQLRVAGQVVHGDEPLRGPEAAAIHGAGPVEGVQRKGVLRGLAVDHVEGAHAPAGLHGASRMRTVPAPASTSTSSPSLIRLMRFSMPTTVGMPISRATMAL